MILKIPGKHQGTPIKHLSKMIILYNTTLNIYTSSQMAQRTTVEQRVQLS